MSNRFNSALYFGRVMHRRLKPVAHRLEYRVFSMLIDLDELGATDAELKFFSRGKFNLFSFYDGDYGNGAQDDLATHGREVLAEADIDASGAIKLLCYPRILGYAFNPLAIYYCHDRDGALSAILYEVRNTFGGKHSYLILFRSRVMPPSSGRPPTRTSTSRPSCRWRCGTISA